MNAFADEIIFYTVHLQQPKNQENGNETPSSFRARMALFSKKTIRSRGNLATNKLHPGNNNI